MHASTTFQLRVVFWGALVVLGIFTPADAAMVVIEIPSSLMEATSSADGSLGVASRMTPAPVRDQDDRPVAFHSSGASAPADAAYSSNGTSAVHAALSGGSLCLDLLPNGAVFIGEPFLLPMPVPDMPLRPA